MAARYTINAHIIDITSDTPTDKDTFLVDTNVWYWTTYSRPGLSANPPTQSQLRAYPQYLASAFTAKSKLLRCGLSLAEIAHLIEKTERDIYTKTHRQQLSTKEYRHNLPTQRAQVVAEIQSAWAQIKSIAQPLDILIDDSSTTSAEGNFGSYCLDGYDLFMIEAMQRAGVNQVITDDGDYAGIDGIQVFTSNQAVLSAARHQAKLMVR